MPETLKTKSGRLIELHPDEEDAAIDAGIVQDPDNLELTDEDFARAKPFDALPATLMAKLRGLAKW